MKIIFSRKGFDSTAGGAPSPIINGAPYSLPIPTNESPYNPRFKDINGLHCKMVRQITKNKISENAFCHLDPDIDHASRPRLQGWKGAFGQTGIAAGHLDKNGVTKGDIFLFFGLFQALQTNPTIQFTGRRAHVIFGWMQIGEILELGEDGRWVLKQHPWLKDHPHVSPGWNRPNRLYIANEKLNLPGMKTQIAGYGRFSTGHILTNEKLNQPLTSIWNVPAWLNPVLGGTGMTYHPKIERWSENGTVRSTGRGQEFVADIGQRDDALTWLANLFKEHANG